MRFSIIFVALTAALSPVSLAVTIDSDGTITWAPGEECANQCLFKQYDKTPCGFGALSVYGLTRDLQQLMHTDGVFFLQ